jgi:hypothetical protein
LAQAMGRSKLLLKARSKQLAEQGQLQMAALYFFLAAMKSSSPN